MIDCIDVMKLLRMHNGKLDKVTVYGYLDRKAERPTNLKAGVCESGEYAVLKVLGVDLSYYRMHLAEMGVANSDCKYFANGELLLCVEELKRDWWSVSGTLRIGTKEKFCNYVNMLRFLKSADGSWRIEPNELHDINIDAEMGVMAGVCYEQADIPEEVKRLPKMSASLEDMPLVEERGLPRMNAVKPERESSVRVYTDRHEPLFNQEILGRYKQMLLDAQDRRKAALAALAKEQGYGDFSLVRKLYEMLDANMKRRKGMTGQALIKRHIENACGKLANRDYMGMQAKRFLIGVWSDVVRYSLTGDEGYSFSGVAEKCMKEAFGEPEYAYAGILGAVVGVDLYHCEEELRKAGVSFSHAVSEDAYLLCTLGYLSFNDASLVARLFQQDRLTSMAGARAYWYVDSEGGNETVCDHLGYLTEAGRKLSLPMQNAMSAYFTGKTVSQLSPYTLDSELVQRGVSEATRLGALVEVGGGYESQKNLQKELFIYERLLNVCKRTDIADTDAYIAEWEKGNNVRLEEKQREAVRNLTWGASCLGGSAGSGKTTCMGCVAYVLERNGKTVTYGAPTGKAARVLTASVGRQARTLDSLALGASSEGWYVIDEMSMVSLDLLYRCMVAFEEAEGYVFLGDVSQLPSIGKGMAYRDLLGCLPCTFLDVPKRAKEDSGIVENASVVCGGFSPLRERADFHIISCPDDDIPETVEVICKGYLNSDIQVITPVVKATYPWGAKALNRRLQPLFNPTGKGYVIGGTHYRIGDKVIHTSKNSYSMQWYDFSDGVAAKKWGCGVSNGEIGKFLGVFRSDLVRIEQESAPKPEGFAYYSSMRDDDTYEGHFAVVRYEDYLTGDSYDILYRIKQFDDEGYGGDDAQLLDLFYAGSVHKMQGSQAEIAVCCVGRVNFAGFLSRNMLYTALTRGSKEVYLVGSAWQISEMRKAVAGAGAVTCMELIRRMTPEVRV